MYGFYCDLKKSHLYLSIYSFGNVIRPSHATINHQPSPKDSSRLKVTNHIISNTDMKLPTLHVQRHHSENKHMLT